MDSVEYSPLRRGLAVRRLQGDGIGRWEEEQRNHGLSMSMKRLEAELGSALDELPADEFLNRFRSNASDCLNNAYATLNYLERRITKSGSLASSLPQDVFSLVDIQIHILHDFYVSSKVLTADTAKSFLVDGLLSVFRNLANKQTQYQKMFLVDLESSCTAANDFFRMMEQTEQVWKNTLNRYPFLNQVDENSGASSSPLHREVTELIALYGGDAVEAAEKVQIFVFRSVAMSRIPNDLFGRDWEDQFTHNEVVLLLIRHLEGFLSDIHNWLCSDFLFHKVVAALVRGAVSFYVRCLVLKADKTRRKRRLRLLTKPSKWSELRHKGIANLEHLQAFANPARAVSRIMYDIDVLRNYFEKLAKGTNSVLTRVVSTEFSALVIIYECLGLAVGQRGMESLEEMILVLHKRTGSNPMVTRLLLGDLWFLAAPPSQKHVIYDVVGLMQADLQLVSTRMKEKPLTLVTSSLSGNETTSLNDRLLLSPNLDDMLKNLYEDRMMQEWSLCSPCLPRFGLR